MLRPTNLLAIAVLLSSSTTYAVISLDGSSGWSAITYSSPAQSDFIGDQGTGQGAADIVGSANGSAPFYAGFYKAYDDKGTESLLDDEIAFRVRLSEFGGTTYQGTPGYAKYLIVGIDIGGEGALDLFVAANSQNIRYYATGDDLNISPSTTSVSELSAYAQTVGGQNTLSSSIFTYLPVSATTDSTTPLDTDLGNDGLDYFASFKLSMSTVILAAEDSYLESNPGGTPPTLDLMTAMTFLVATSTQPNAYNQDLGGYDNQGGAVSKQDTTTWVELGAASDPYTADGTSPVPEPATYALLLGLAVLGCVKLRRR
ncbi:PEP-CTERM sorting domain-containing protein [Coraliomargarita parva]|uniref:PEP-CTERM sorting domain-containing protein n=1 Tax=Coraliomargarita parva TaxID=3014050 RepID=UPI0022B30C6C|nr:PEP-CTERM sorting domain-containing protein [Coraliomargarita parva]